MSRCRIGLRRPCHSRVAPIHVICNPRVAPAPMGRVAGLRGNESGRTLATLRPCNPAPHPSRVFDTLTPQAMKGDYVNPSPIHRPAFGPVFRRALAAARAERSHVAAATTAPADLPIDVDFYLSADRCSGYGIAKGGELVAVFSTVRGRGAALAAEAADSGARRLDCFDGFLVDFYTRHGWQICGREANWTEGGPDVVYMNRPDPCKAHGARPVTVHKDGSQSCGACAINRKADR